MAQHDSFEIEESSADPPERIIINGPPGIGKSTFIAGAPGMFIFDLERSTLRIPHVKRNKKPIATYGEFIAGLEWMRHGRHEIKAFGFDTLDFVETLVHRSLCDRDGVTTVEKATGGYGNGVKEAAERIRDVLLRVDDIVFNRNLHFATTSHAQTETVKNTGGYDYQRHTLKLRPAAAAFAVAAVDHVLFATRNIIVSESVFDEKRARAIAMGDRVVHTTEGPAHVAKSRAKLPPTMPLSWHDFVCHLAKAGWPRLLRETVVDNARRLGNPETRRAVEGMVRENPDVGTLASANKRLCDLLAATAPGATVATPPAAEPTKGGTPAAAGTTTG